jgi:hypothetical protein
MRTLARLSLLGLVASGPLLQAQRPNLGVSFNLGFPTGGYRSQDWPATPAASGPIHQSFDTAFGAQFTASFPLQEAVALRACIGAMTASGSQMQDAWGRRGLRNNLFAIGGDVQIFLDKGAMRHRGTYLYAGPSMDFEQWSYTYTRYWNTYLYTYDRKSRPAANFGFGHSFPVHSGRFTLEVGFHKTLSGNNTSQGEPSSTDFAKLGVGWVF